jgi:pimeloyl-ACP methyl ester carboxylesterase
MWVTLLPAWTLKADNFLKRPLPVDKRWLMPDLYTDLLFDKREEEPCRVAPMKLPLRIFGVVLVAIAVFAVAGLIAVWAPDRPVEALSGRWAQQPSQFIAVSGLQVHLRDEGPRDDPYPIVLIHGTSDSLHTWEGWAQALKQKRRVVRFDLPAFGLTGPRPDNDYSMAAYVSFVRAVLDALGIKNAVLAGNSLGGQIAWETASAMPQRVHQLVLVDSGGYTMQPKSVPIGFRIARMPGVRSMMQYILPRGVIESSLRNVYGNPALVTPDLVDRYYELTLRTGNRAALGYRMQQGLSGDEKAIRNLKVPTLILWGGKDLLIPVDNAKRFAADITGAKLVIFNDLGHVPQEEDPQQTVQWVQAFVH